LDQNQRFRRMVEYSQEKRLACAEGKRASRSARRPSAGAVPGRCVSFVAVGDAPAALLTRFHDCFFLTHVMPALQTRDCPAPVPPTRTFAAVHPEASRVLPPLPPKIRACTLRPPVSRTTSFAPHRHGR